VSSSPEASLDQVCRLAIEAQIYAQCERYYPFVLGAQPARLIDLAAFYAAVANEGQRPTPHAIESIEQDGRKIYEAPKRLIGIGSTDRAAMYQLKTMLQGVLSRGTARAASHLAPYVAGKTGTSDEENDAWFVGFSNDVTIGVWVGYDNAKGKRTLGGGQTGGKIALPIFQSIMEAAWANHAPKTALRGPSREAQRQLIALPINLRTGERVTNGSPSAFTEHFRLDQTGRFMETQYRLVSRDQIYSYSGDDYWNDRPSSYPSPNNRGTIREHESSTPYLAPPRYQEYRYQEPRYEERYQQAPRYQERSQESRSRSLQVFPFTPPWFEEREAPRQRRVDPDYFWGQRRGW
jgi:membrane carboxypeptidase/penicillin-binding protein